MASTESRNYHESHSLGPTPICAAVCRHCGSLQAYYCGRPSGAPRFSCRECGRDFSVISGTLLVSHKLPLRGFLGQRGERQEHAGTERHLGLNYKTAFVLCHETREAMSGEIKDRQISARNQLRHRQSRAGDYFSAKSLRRAAALARIRDARIDRFASGGDD